jgi:hypothetical protein
MRVHPTCLANRVGRRPQSRQAWRQRRSLDRLFGILQCFHHTLVAKASWHVFAHPAASLYCRWYILIGRDTGSFAKSIFFNRGRSVNPAILNFILQCSNFRRKSTGEDGRHRCNGQRLYDKAGGILQGRTAWQQRPRHTAQCRCKGRLQRHTDRKAAQYQEEEYVLNRCVGFDQ